MTAIHVQLDYHQDVVLRWRYDRQLVDLIKMIPRDRRIWDGDDKTWTITDVIDADWFIGEARRLGHTILGDQRFGTGIHDKDRTEAKTWCDTMFAALPHDLGEKAYKALIRVLHPDVGGDEQATRQLIDARDRTKQGAAR